MVGIRAMISVAGAAAVLAAASSAFAADQLSAKGAVLAASKLGPGVSAIQREVDLQGDVPTASYVIAQDNTNVVLQRTAEGYWIPWDRDESTLIDNRFARAGNRLVFKIVAEDLSGAAYPLSFMIAYRVDGKLKYGVFGLERTP